MKRTIDREWLFLAAFVAFGCVGFGLYYVFATYMAASDSIIARMRSSGTPVAGRSAADLDGGNLVLPLGEVKNLGTAKVRYRGYTGKKTIRIDVIVPELDPFTTYAHDISTGSARNGFMLAGRYCKLIAVNKNRIQLTIPQKK